MDRDGHDFHALFQYMFYTWIQNCTLFESFLSSPLAGKRDLVVTIFVRCMCVRPCVRRSGFVRTITCTIMHGFGTVVALEEEKCHLKHFEVG